MKPSLYMETTIPSYLAAWPSRDLIVAAHQQLTHDWWQRRRGAFRLYVSQLVLDECGLGDRDAASRRLALLKGVPLVPADDEVFNLADQFVGQGCIPVAARADAVHLALATVNEMEYFLTWNCVHLNNAQIVEQVRAICVVQGYGCPVICTPEELMG
ncbi:MAG: hypothetical protein A3K19_13975 [Lentisphaerae bacterium RIFOXYB12_FULL_65_16]|nr:MAG: hypothetical protein A3K18_25975 [Lentisphaerae bacterium RIFOXYA12_64_32]OGV88222.1 MAG: hypothetical protein A3K19_13975 [Lentisphaerae bacterium RIFOXYB12_FULL_65_16]